MSAPSTSPTPRRLRRFLPAIGTGLLGLVVGVSVGGTSAEPATSAAPAPTTTATVTATSAPQVRTETVTAAPVTAVPVTQTVTETVTAQASVPAVTKPQRFVAPARTPRPKSAPVSGGFANCSEARAAGAAPLHVGDPGYRPQLDRDKDGVACES